MRHRYTRALLGIAAALFATGVQQASAAATCGDLNGSGARDPGDAVRLNLAINVGANPADCGNSGSLQCGDLNHDPADRAVGDADLDDIAPFQLGPESAHSSSVPIA